jgi:hypothetical protein
VIQEDDNDLSSRVYDLKRYLQQNQPEVFPCAPRDSVRHLQTPADHVDGQRLLERSHHALAVEQLIGNFRLAGQSGTYAWEQPFEWLLLALALLFAELGRVGACACVAEVIYILLQEIVEWRKDGGKMEIRK